ncbi:protein transport protein Sec24A-like [Limulus polyphemus]|uniref:Protein transport protein Sec24A-like n=1 Tax=Limulus polyphemus TaxID=6850 RepID=A0ABM1B7Z9_LIMPO|nr:protein transport protein Sec24A-like [Limulus polyphemus]XP_022244046.1 protein transport protein Sec24A-like [Limulus polyphemus]
MQPQSLYSQNINSKNTPLESSCGGVSIKSDPPFSSVEFNPSYNQNPYQPIPPSELEQYNHQTPRINGLGNLHVPVCAQQNGPGGEVVAPSLLPSLSNSSQFVPYVLPGSSQQSAEQLHEPRQKQLFQGALRSGPLQAHCSHMLPRQNSSVPSPVPLSVQNLPQNRSHIRETPWPSVPSTSATNYQTLHQGSGEPRFNGLPTSPGTQGNYSSLVMGASSISPPPKPPVQSLGFTTSCGNVGQSIITPRWLQKPDYIKTSPTSQSVVGHSSPPANSIGSTQQYCLSKQHERPVGGIAVGYDPGFYAQMARMNIHGSSSFLSGNKYINLLQDRNVLPSVPVEPPKTVTSYDKPTCNPDIFRCTMTKIPESHSLLQKSRLPLGILIHPFKDLDHIPVIQCGCIVRCRSCRTYINPYVTFVDQCRWKCNLCFRVNDLPEEFLYDRVTMSYGDPFRRPEMKNATVEFIAPSEYMLRPPQPAVYLYVLDVSHGALETGYLSVFCKTLLEELHNLPGDCRTRIGFITFDRSVHFYDLSEGRNQPSMLVMSDVEDVFLPLSDGLIVNFYENKSLIEDLLKELPSRFVENEDTNSALGAALQAAYKLVAPTGGRVTVMQTRLPNIGPGALKPREDPTHFTAKDVANLGPATDFYKKLALDCSRQQIAVDLFMLNSQYADLASLVCISKFSAGSIYYFPGFHVTLNKFQTQKYQKELQHYLTRKIGFEAVMRIRCTRGLSLHTFHGNFFVRSTDLLSLPNVNPDTGYGLQIAIEDNLTDCKNVCFQVAVLYTSSRGERRIRVHTLSLPVVKGVTEVLESADQECIVGLLAKMAVDRSISSSLADAREAMVSACCDILNVYQNTLPAGQTAGALVIPYCSRLIPLFILALLKNVAFRVGVETRLDERVFAMEQMKCLPLSYLMTHIYPRMYPVHALDDNNAISTDDGVTVSQPPVLQLTIEKLDYTGAYLLDAVSCMYLYIGRGISGHFCSSVLGVSTFAAIQEGMIGLPELDTPESVRLRYFVAWLLSQRPFHSPLLILREDSKDRYKFLQHMIEDRSESSLSYYEFLQHLKQHISK